MEEAINSTGLLDKEQISVSKDQLLQQSIECMEEQLKKYIDGCSEEQLDLKCDEVFQEFGSNRDKLNKWIKRELSKQFQEGSSRFLSNFPSQGLPNDIVKSKHLRLPKIILKI